MNALFELLVLPLVVFMALVAVKSFDLIYPIKIPDHNRNSQIDGLRGLLALFVFVHHSIIWENYTTSGVWQNPQSNFYTNIGQVGVTLFFMITGYLFISKVRNIDQNWMHFYISRFLRLTPMFALSLVAIILIVGVNTDWELRTTLKQLIISVARWIPFTLLGMPNINGDINTFTINAAVTWTLVYEWFFYLSLPVMAFIFRKKVQSLILTASTVSILLFFIYPSMKIHLLSFAFGFLASNLQYNERIMKLSRSRYSGLIVLALIIFEGTYFNTTYSIIPIIICGLCFILISSGCSMFGLLKTNIMRKLGEATYSIYLLHGIILYIFMSWGFNDFLDRYSLITISAAAFAAIFISCLTYKIIELPFINIGYKIKQKKNSTLEQVS